MYLPVSQADSVGFQDGLVHIQLYSGDQLKKRDPYSSAILTPTFSNYSSITGRVIKLL